MGWKTKEIRGLYTLQMCMHSNTDCSETSWCSLSSIAALQHNTIGSSCRKVVENAGSITATLGEQANLHTYPPQCCSSSGSAGLKTLCRRTLQLPFCTTQHYNRPEFT